MYSFLLNVQLTEHQTVFRLIKYTSAIFMKKRLRNLLGNLHQQVPVNRLVGITGKNILLPFYHTVSDKRLAHISNLYTLRNTELFVRDLEFYCRHYQPVSAEELYTIISSRKKLSRPVFHLTFDDGLRELYTLVAPILEKRGIPATIFLNTGFIDNKALFYRYKVSLLVDAVKQTGESIVLKNLAEQAGIDETGKQAIIHSLLGFTYQDQQRIDSIAVTLEVDFDSYLTQQQPYLNSSEIADLLKRGFTMGSHSIDHPLFKTIPLAEQKRQVTESFTTLSNQFGITEKYFSFPFSDEGVSMEFLNWLHAEAGCKLTFGISGLKSDSSYLHLHRIPVEGTHKPIEQLITSEYLYYVLKAPFFKNTIRRS